MSRETDNKAIVGRWFEGFWANPWNPKIIDELAAEDMLLQYSLHAPRRGREDVRNFIMRFREAFPDLNFWGAADLIAEGDYVVGRWEVAARTPDPPSATFSPAPFRRRPAGRCGLPERLCSGSRTAKLPKKSAWTMA
jgi:SnoaL-like polyketide cyclase